jgi:hypothetical protein
MRCVCVCRLGFDKQFHVEVIFLLSVALPLSALRAPRIPIGQRRFYARLAFKIMSLLRCLTDLPQSRIEPVRRAHNLSPDLINHNGLKKSHIVSDLVSRIFCEWTVTLFIGCSYYLGTLASIQKICAESNHSL